MTRKISQIATAGVEVFMTKQEEVFPANWNYRA
jgi:hypothetical protein